jgi:hypothetical protein
MHRSHMSDDLDPLEQLISNDDLAVCERVVRTLSDNRASLAHKRFRELRKIAVIFTERMDQSLEKLSTKKRRTENNQRMRQLDQKFRDNTELRQKRMGALSALVFEPTTTPLIASGDAVAGTSTTASTNDARVGDTNDDDDDDENVQTKFNEPKQCYVCKRYFVDRHHFYDLLCGPCAKLNWFKRNRVVDLSGKIVLLTGGRIKIGREAALRLLRCA